MALIREWRFRIIKWIDEMKNQLYTEHQEINMIHFPTKERMGYKKAIKNAFSPILKNEIWGKEFHYYWFMGNIDIPKTLIGKRVVLKMDIGSEGLVYLNGKVASGLDENHNMILLSESAKGNEKFELVIEGYAGHNRQIMPDNEGCPPNTFAGISIGEYHEDMYQLYMDSWVLFETREALSKGNISSTSMLVEEIDECLKEMTRRIDLWNGVPNIDGARNALVPALKAKNGSSAPQYYMMGQSHLDLVWLWTLEETKRKIARTFSSQIDLMEKYPEYIYLQSQPALFEIVKDLYPDLYKRVKEKVKSGQIIPEGGMWVEPDTNITSGESLIRQFVYGKKFFKDEFGVDNEMLWLPDVFGYSGALPQIMQGCGIKYFATVKLGQTYSNSADAFPVEQFVWEGIDGSEVYANLMTWRTKVNPTEMVQEWNERKQTDNIKSRMVQFGYGDGGGGANRDDLEALRRMEDLQGMPKMKITNPLDFFHDTESDTWPEKRYVGELYYAAHRGTYTTMAFIKKSNRLSELMMREAEYWWSNAFISNNKKYPKAELTKIWKLLLYNQFHDILPGTSIPEVNQDVKNDFDSILADTADMAKKGHAASIIENDDDSLTLFNSITHNRTGMVALPEDWEGATYNGVDLPTQEIDNTMYVKPHLKANSYITIEKAERGQKQPSGVVIGPRWMENNFLKLTFNDKGEITSIFDKISEREWVAGGKTANEILMYKDDPSMHDAWEIERMYVESPVDLNATTTIEPLYGGTLQGAIEVKKTFASSTFSQKIIMYADSYRIDFVCDVDWQERHRLLKVAFPVNIYTNTVLSEIQFGYVERPTHKNRAHDDDRFECTNQKWSALCEPDKGFAILNNCKYGISAYRDTMELSLLRAPTAPDPKADLGHHEFTYSIFPFNTPFVNSNVTKEAYALNIPIMSAAGNSGEAQLYELSADTVIIDTVKLAEDKSGDLILRLYESAGIHCDAQLNMNAEFISCSLCDMLENELSETEELDEGWDLEFKPFEIKTLRFKK